jgi:hypothetical protein
VKPSGPRALEEPRLERAWITSYSEGIEQRDRLSSVEIMGGKRSNISSSMGAEKK